MAKKRANGEGNIRKRADGRWEGRYTAGYHPETGKRIIENVLGKTQAECKAKLVRHLRKAKRPYRHSRPLPADGRKDYLDAANARGLHAPHLHPRNKTEAGRGSTNDGQFHGADSISPAGRQSTGEETASSPVRFYPFRVFRQVGQKMPSREIAFNRLVTILCRLMCTCGKE